MFFCGTNQEKFSCKDFYRKTEDMVSMDMAKKFIPDSQIKVGRRIQDLIDKNNVRQKDVAAAIGKQHSAVSKLCNGSMRPTQEVLLKLAAYFGVSSHFILTGAEPPTEQPIKPIDQPAKATSIDHTHQNPAPHRVEREDGFMADQKNIDRLFSQLESSNQQNAQLNAKIDRLMEREDRYIAKEEALQEEISNLKKEILELKLALESFHKTPSSYKKASNGDSLGE